MAFARGKFGIEYNTAPRREEPGPFVPLVVTLVFAVSLGSLVWTVYGRLKGDRVETVQAEAAREEDLRAAAEAAEKAARDAEKTVSLKGVSNVTASVQVRPVARESSAPTPVRERPAQVRNLLRRLDEANRKHDVEMAVSTIEQLRALPDKSAADMEDRLARELGELNLQRLFVMRSPRWVIDVTVGRGDSASRIAAEHGSTFSSLVRLNPKVDLNRVRIGQRLKVMNHPKFRLLVTRASKTADLLLDGRFFKRYYLAGPVTGTVGGYELPAETGAFWTSVGISLKKSDRRELGELLPKGTSVILSDL